jgi:hypothetical protein
MFCFAVIYCLYVLLCCAVWHAPDLCYRNMLASLRHTVSATQTSRVSWLAVTKLLTPFAVLWRAVLCCALCTGWRDPFVLEKPTTTNPWWYVMIGAGVRNKCGTALVYRSKDLTEGEQGG